MDELSAYQSAAARTMNPDLTDDQRLLNIVFGLIGEFGELVDHIKKNQFQGHELDSEQLIVEVGDLAWYTVSLLTHFGIDAGTLPPLSIRIVEHAEHAVFPLQHYINAIAVIVEDQRNGIIHYDFVDHLTTNTWLILIFLSGILNLLTATSLQSALDLNIAKLDRRYVGAFDAEHSRQRT